MKTPSDPFDKPLILPPKPAPAPAPSPQQERQSEFEKDDWLPDGVRRAPPAPPQASPADWGMYDV